MTIATGTGRRTARGTGPSTPAGTTGRTARSTGLVLVLASSAAFGTSGSLAGALIHAGWTPAGAVLARVVVAALVLTVPAVLALRGRWSVLRRSARTIGTYGVVAVAGAQLAYFNAVSHLSVGVALLLEYQGVVLVVGWLWLRTGRRPRPLVLAGAAVALAGLALVLDVATGVRLDGVGVVWGLLAAVGLAVYFIVVADDREPAPPIVLSWAGLVIGAVALVIAGVVGLVDLRAAAAPVVLAGRAVSWIVPVAGLSLVAAALAFVLGTVGARRLGATVASFVGLTEVLFAVLFAWLLVGQLPTQTQLVGGAVVVAGIALVRADDLRAAGPHQRAVEALGGAAARARADAPVPGTGASASRR